jgi:hypothetical protein
VGGKPSKGTSADHRLKANRSRPAPKIAFGGKKAPSFGKGKS